MAWKSNRAESKPVSKELRQEAFRRRCRQSGLWWVRGTGGAGQGGWSPWSLEEMSLSTGLE